METDIAAAQADATAAVSKNVTQDGRLTAVESKNTTQDSRLTAVEGVNSTQDNRLFAVESKNVTQDSRLTAVEILGGLAPGDVSDSTMAPILGNPASASSVKIAEQYAKQGQVIVSVTDFPWRAKGDWVSGTGTGTDNLAAFNAAFTYAKSITGFAVKLFIPAGKFRLTNEWDIWRSSPSTNTLTIEGADALSTFLISDFYGAGKVLMRCVDPTGVDRAAATNIRKLQFGSVSRSGAVPVYLDILGGGESRYEELRFGSSNNTHFRASSLQNVRMRDIVSFYGGDHYNYKSTDALTFDVTSGGAVTASGAIFSAGDVGKILNIFPTSEDQRIKYTISAYTDSTHVTVSVGTGATILAATAAKASFEEIGRASGRERVL